jgi:hypothetical protein
MSVRFVLNVDTVTIDESLSLRMSTRDLQDALRVSLQDALQAQRETWAGLTGGEYSLERAQVNAPSLRNAEGLSHAITSSVLAEQGALSHQARSSERDVIACDFPEGAK